MLLESSEKLCEFLKFFFPRLIIQFFILSIQTSVLFKRLGESAFIFKRRASFPYIGIYNFVVWVLSMVV